MPVASRGKPSLSTWKRSTTHRSSDHCSRDRFLESFFDLPLTTGRNDRRSRTPAKPQPKYEQRYERSRGIE